MKHSLALQQALFTHLQADAGILAALGGAKIFDAPPHAQSGAASPPYITIGDETVAAWTTKTEDGAEYRLTLTIWSAARGYTEIKAVMAALHAALDGASLALTEGALVDLRFVSAETGRERRTRLRHVKCVFRALVEADGAA